MVNVFALQSEERRSILGRCIPDNFLFFIYFFLFLPRVHFISHTSVLRLLSVQYRTFLFVCIAV